MEEMQTHSEFDIDTDGTVSIEEAKVTQKHCCKIIEYIVHGSKNGLLYV